MKSQYSETINESAREWFTLAQSSSFTKDQQQELDAWLSENELHQRAFNDYQRIWDDLAVLGKTAEGRRLRAVTQRQSIFALLAQKLVSLIQMPQSIAALASVTLAVSFVFFYPTKNQEFKTFQTAAAETSVILLEDGSEITLSGKTSIKAWFTKHERHAELVSGQAYFKIAKDSGRPFWIGIDNTLVRVVGTEFDINKEADQVSVSVAEGVVQVFDAKSADIDQKFQNTAELKHTTLTKGQYIVNSKVAGLGKITELPASNIASWREGKLYFEQAKLKNVIAAANRYYQGEISYDENIADLQLTAAISNAQIQQLPEILSQLLPVKTVKIDDKHIRLSAK